MLFLLEGTKLTFNNGVLTSSTLKYYWYLFNVSSEIINVSHGSVHV